MRIDWQAYDDGSLSAPERAAAEALLSSDARAQAELDGLRRFKASLQGLRNEPVPLRRLESAFDRRGLNLRLFLVAALVAIVAVSWAWWVFRTPKEVRFDPTGANASTVTTNLETARTWLALRSGLDVPLDLLPVLPVKGASFGAAWGRLEYQVGRRSVSLYVRKDKGTLSSLPTDFKFGHDVAEVRSTGKPALVWSDGGYEFMAVGEDVEDLWETVRMVRRRGRG